MSKPAQVNGDFEFSSETLSHITSYPLISDSINFYKSQPLGAKSLDLANSFYASYGKPIIPYFETPISIVSPYAKQVDQFGAKSLDTVDNHVPALKKTGFNELYDNATSTAYFPFKLAGESRDYVFNTYNDERKKTPEEGLIGTGKAFISTELRIASESLHAVADWFGPKGQQGLDEIEKLKNHGQQKAGEYKKTANQKKDEMTNSH